MSKISFVYILHATLVVLTSFLMARAGVTNWYFILLIALPLIIAIVPKYGKFSYGLNIRLLFPISVGLFCVALYHVFPSLVGNNNDTLALYGIKNADTGIGQKFFEVNDIFKDSVTVLYAICAAFLLWKGLNDFDELKSVLYEEVNEVNSIANYLNYFDESGEHTDHNRNIGALVRGHLFQYLENILKDSRIVVSASNTLTIAEISSHVGKLRAFDTNDQISLEEIMKAVTRLSHLRAKRKVCIEKRMSPYILALMFLMSVAMISSFFGDATGIFSFDYAYVFLMSAFYTALFMTLLDLSSPFQGYWSIKLEAVQETLDTLRTFNPHSDFVDSLTHPSSTPK